MVQRAHFAYDDEELPGYWGIAGGCFPFEEEEETEEELLDPASMDENPDLPQLRDLLEKSTDPQRERMPQRKEENRQPYWPTDSDCSRPMRDEQNDM